MLHTSCTQGNLVDSRLLVVGSQIGNLSSDPYFGHNLCFKCSNGSYEPILNIYVSRTFQWYKERFHPLSFVPWNLIFWKFGTPIFKMRVHLRVWGFIRSHSSTLPGEWDVTPGLPSWPAPLQAFALVVNPRLGLRHQQQGDFLKGNK